MPCWSKTESDRSELSLMILPQLVFRTHCLFELNSGVSVRSCSWYAVAEVAVRAGIKPIERLGVAGQVPNRVVSIRRRMHHRVGQAGQTVDRVISVGRGVAEFVGPTRVRDRSDVARRVVGEGKVGLDQVA